MAIEIADTWPMASFNDVEFPYTELSIKGSVDHFVHKYLHRPGGEVEPLGRHLNEFAFKCKMHTSTRRFSDYIQIVSEIISLGDTEQSYPLVVPPMGNIPIKAKLIGWNRNYVALIRSGESVDFTFLEDTADQFSFFNTVGPLVVTLGDQRDALLAAMKIAQLTNAVPLGLLEKIMAAIDRVLAARDQYELYAQLYAQKADNLFELCGQFSALPYFSLPTNAPAIESLFSIWSLAVEIVDDPMAKGRVKESFVTDRFMTITGLSISLYGDTLHAQELLRLNRFDNAMAIPASTLIVYYR